MLEKCEADRILHRVSEVMSSTTGIALQAVMKRYTSIHTRPMPLRIFWEAIYEITKERKPDSIIDEDRMQMILFLCRKYKISTEGLE